MGATMRGVAPHADRGLSFVQAQHWPCPLRERRGVERTSVGADMRAASWTPQEGGRLLVREFDCGRERPRVRVDRALIVAWRSVAEVLGRERTIQLCAAMRREEDWRRPCSGWRGWWMRGRWLLLQDRRQRWRRGNRRQRLCLSPH